MGVYGFTTAYFLSILSALGIFFEDSFQGLHAPVSEYAWSLHYAMYQRACYLTRDMARFWRSATPAHVCQRVSMAVSLLRANYFFTAPFHSL